MKSTILWGLVVLNFMLLASLIGRFGSGAGSAMAQPARGQQRPGDYLMIPGEVTGGTSGIVYIVDMTNGKLGAMSFDESNRRLVSMQGIDLAPIFERAGAGGGGERPRPNR